MILFEDGEAELAQLAFQFLFLAAGVLVAQGMELRRVVHVGEVGQLVADNVAHQRLGQEHEVARELNDLFIGAVTQFAHPAAHFKAGRLQPQSVSDLAGIGQQHGMGLDLHGAADNTGERALYGFVDKVGRLVGLQMQGVTIPVVEDVAWHSGLALNHDTAAETLDHLPEAKGYGLGTGQCAQALTVGIDHLPQVAHRDAQRCPQQQVTIGLISEPHRGHAPAQFHKYLTEFLVLDESFHSI